MSAVVTIPNPNPHVDEPPVLDVDVPKANGYSVDEHEWLHLHTARYGEQIAVFKTWYHVVITPDRGPDGRFVKRDS